MKSIQSNGFVPIIARAITEMEELHGEFASLDEINLAELGRRTGLSRAKLRRLKANGFKEATAVPVKQKASVLDGFTSVLDTLLSNSCSAKNTCRNLRREIGRYAAYYDIQQMFLKCFL